MTLFVLFNSLDGVEITADDFDWFFYQGSAMGLQVDLNSGSICNGKILLGSYTKKPLWVDHSATTVSTKKLISVLCPSHLFIFASKCVYICKCCHTPAVN